MSVQDRMAEYAVLQTIGFRPMRTMRLVLLESTILCLLGGMAGATAAIVVLSVGGFAIGAEGATVALEPSVGLGFFAMTISLAVGIAAGLAPSIQAATVPIVRALRGV